MSPLESERRLIEYKQNWRDEIEHIPYIQFPADWQIQIIPPFSDAVVRFRVKLPSGNIKSIYLDSRESIGFYGEPYWEVYPVGEDVARCSRADIETLLELIADES